MLVLAGIVDFSLRTRRMADQPTWVIWTSLASYLLFLAMAVVAEVLALAALKSGSGSETSADLIEIALITAAGLLTWNVLIELTTALEGRTRFPIWAPLTVFIAGCQAAGTLAVVWT